MANNTANKSEKQLLRETEISEQGPGTALADFETLLQFVEQEEIVVSGKHQLFPMSRLRDLDQRMRRPLNLQLKRPQLRSYPNLMGLYMLLRASRLAVVAKKDRLVLDPPVLESWRSLNPTERYFSLLETWLVYSSPQIVGEDFGDPWMTIRTALLPPELWMKESDDPTGDETKWRSPWGLHSVIERCYAATAELFGFCEIQAEPLSSQKGWSISKIRATPFGVALLRALLFSGDKGTLMLDADHDPQAIREALAPYFPQWENSLDRGEREYREGVYYFKVSLGPKSSTVWRRLAVPHNASMSYLANVICSAFNFDMDHLYEFSLKDVDGSTMLINHPMCEEGYNAEEFAVGELALPEKGEMTYLFDFGDSWRFHIKLERIDAEASPLEEIRVVEKKGKPPPQYHCEDDFYDDEYDDDDPDDDQEE